MELDDRIRAVRAFNRFYTRRIGVLEEGLAGSPFPLTEARVLYELAHRPSATAALLGRDLGIDAGYLSRILRSFETRGLLERARARHDGRHRELTLTAAGRTAFAPLDTRSQEDVRAMLEPLPHGDQDRLVEAMRTIERILEPGRARRPGYVLRPPQPGDMGAVVQLHGALYAQEYGWDERFEALVAGIVARFVDHVDGTRERCWIAEVDGDVVGSVFLVKHSATVGQLRLLIVHPRARGLGLGERLVDECVRFARRAGYRRVRLWTNSVLVAARHIYEKAGFRLVRRERHRSFGHALIGETWELAL